MVVNQLVVDKEERKAVAIDVGIPSESIVRKKEQEKLEG